MSDSVVENFEKLRDILGRSIRPNCFLLEYEDGLIEPTDIEEDAGYLGLIAPPIGTLLEIDRPRSLAILAKLLGQDLPFQQDKMTSDEAKESAQIFIDLFDESAAFYTNLTATQKSGRAWVPLTTSTFDMGIIVRSRNERGILWLKTEK